MALKPGASPQECALPTPLPPPPPRKGELFFLEKNSNRRLSVKNDFGSNFVRHDSLARDCFGDTTKRSAKTGVLVIWFPTLLTAVLFQVRCWKLAVWGRFCFDVLSDYGLN